MAASARPSDRPDVPAEAAHAGFRSLPDLIRHHAAARPAAAALADSRSRIDYAQLDALMDRVAGALQREGLQPGQAVAICARSSVEYVVVFLGALRAGAVVAPLSPSVTPATFQGMLADSEAGWLFFDEAAVPLLGEGMDARLITFDDVPPAAGTAGPAPGHAPAAAAIDARPFTAWLDGAGAGKPRPVAIQPQWAFNIIYSSGTTGTPKGIVQPHAMRWIQAIRLDYGYSPDAVSLIATPLYSNTTLVVLFPTLAHGGSAVLMEKFDALRYLELAERHRATHTMLVPVQYQRLMAVPEFARFDLSSFVLKFCTSAPFAAMLKADVLARWPGGLVEFYGMTEGGGTCILLAHEHPQKLHTVGQPAAGHDIRLIDEQGREVGEGAAGEVVGHSPSMMSGYHRQPQKTREAEWYDATGKRFIRTGDVGRFDSEGFLVLLDRRKDVIISGGFNIYPSDLEAVLLSHPQVGEAAVVGAPSARWGETPVGFIVLRDPDGRGAGAGSGSAAANADAKADSKAAANADANADAGADSDDAARQLCAAILSWTNQRLGRTQRLAELHLVAELPRSAIGKVLKRDLRDRLAGPQSR